ncbi:MAG: efflux transporter outer membrane subunit, partial [Verrucomicrobiae bacterium]|nr:efflux transporter outer membrane subunit [Verrucomicrobiae bacterium]
AATPATPAADLSPPQETRDRILDAAENLFADHGFSKVSLRQITAEAGVNLAAVNYHFGSKDALVFEVLSRIVDPINRERLRLLDLLEGEFPAGAPVERIVEAAFRPVIMRMERSDRDAAVFLKLAGRCLGEREELLPETMLRVFREVAERFTAAFRRALPKLDARDIFWRMHFSFGALAFALTKGDQLKVMSQGAVDAIDPEETLAQIVAFTAAGMAGAPVAARKSPPKRQTPVATAALALMAGLALSSCAGTSPKDAKHQAAVGEVPAKWRAGGENPGANAGADEKAVAAEKSPDPVLAGRDWVGTFGDDRLGALVDEALDHNKDLRAAAARIEMAEANARIVGASFAPQVDGKFRGARQKRNFIGFPIFGGNEGSGGGGGDTVSSNLNNEFGLSLDLSWEIDLWGRIRAGQSAALSELQATEADRAAADLSIAGQVTRAWFGLLEAREQVVLAEKTLEIFQKTEQAVRDRFNAGIGEAGQNLASQLRLAMVDIETARANLESRREAVKLAARQIEVLLGRYPAGSLESGHALPKMPSAPPAGMPGDLLDRRPDLHASERRLAAADRRLVEAKRALLPAISLSGSAGTSSEQIEDLLNSDFSIWSLAGNAAQPILNGGRLREGVVLRRAQVKQAAAEFEKTALTAFAEVENALTTGESLAARESALRKAADLAGEAYRSSSEEFAAGTGDLLTMLTAQDRWFLQQSRLIAIRRERLDNRVALHLALGGGFSVAKPTLAAAAP